MKKLINSAIFGLFLISSFSMYAATTPDSNKDDGSNLGTSETPQIKDQQKTTNKNSMSKKRAKNKNTNNSQMMESNKKMDTNNDGMISKDEYMTHYETMYGSMKQNDTGTGVSLDDMNNFRPEKATEGGLEGKTRRELDGAIK